MKARAYTFFSVVFMLVALLFAGCEKKINTIEESSKQAATVSKLAGCYTGNYSLRVSVPDLNYEQTTTGQALIRAAIDPEDPTKLIDSVFMLNADVLTALIYVSNTYEFDEEEEEDDVFLFFNKLSNFVEDDDGIVRGYEIETSSNLHFFGSFGLLFAVTFDYIAGGCVTNIDSVARISDLSIEEVSGFNATFSGHTQVPKKIAKTTLVNVPDNTAENIVFNYTFTLSNFGNSIPCKELPPVFKHSERF